MFIALALDQVESINLFKIDGLSEHEICAWSIPNDPRRTTVDYSAAIIDHVKLLIIPGTSTYLTCTRKSDREIVTVVKVDTAPDTRMLGVARTHDCLEINQWMTELANSQHVQVPVKYVDEAFTPTSERDSIVAKWKYISTLWAMLFLGTDVKQLSVMCTSK